MTKVKIVPKNPVSWLRTAFWTGAVIDGKAFLLFFFPGLLPNVTKYVFNIGIFDPYCNQAVLLRMLVALFDLGWTILLVWAALKPLERKGIMLITLFPIITGILILRITTTLNNTVSEAYLVTNVFFILIFIFFIYSYLINCNWVQKLL